MSWQLVGFPKGDRGSGVEFVLDDDLFDDEEAMQWLGSGTRLSRALWPLPFERISEAEELVGATLDVGGAGYYVLRRPRWFVTARRDEPEPMAIEYRLPEEFGFARAAEWIGGWFPGMAYALSPLPTERGTEIEARFGTVPTPGLYQHFLGSSARLDQ